MSLNIVFICYVADSAAHDIALEPFFNYKEVETFNRIEGSKRGKIHVANKCIDDALVGMEKWIGRGNLKNDFEDFFFASWINAMARYEVKFSSRSSRQAELHRVPEPALTTQNARHVYIREPLKPNRTIPRTLMSLNEKLIATR